ncbi:MAG: tetratricopeptide repeat protein [Candidatus Latescibacterota bacterium]
MTRKMLLVALLAGLAAQDVSQAQKPAATEHYRAGYQLLKNGNYRNAAIELEQATTVDPAYGDAFYALGQAYKVLNEYPRAITAFERARQLGTLPERAAEELGVLHYKHGLTQFQQRKYQEAIESFRASLGEQPSDAKAHYAIGLCHNGLRQTEQAQQSFQRAIAADPEYTKAHKALGDIQRSQGAYGAAARLYEKAIEMDSTYMDAYAGLAQARLESSDFEGTVALMRRATRIDPSYADGYVLLGSALNRLGRQHEAVVPLDRAVELAPKDPEARYRLAEALYGKGDDRTALEEARQAVALRRDFHAAEVLLGDIYQRLGQTSEARTWYTRGMQDSRLRDYARHKLQELDGGPARQ